MPQHRPYRKRVRADAEARTRGRITHAAMTLHNEIGPARTTVAAIAARAGVSRPTVYKHFPDDAALLAACSSAYDAAHPAPDPSAWESVADPDRRASEGLLELYEYFEANEAMLANVLRDRDVIPALDALHREITDPWTSAMVDALARGRPVRGRERGELRALLRVAVDFFTWRTLANAGLDPRQASRLMARTLPPQR